MNSDVPDNDTTDPVTTGDTMGPGPGDDNDNDLSTGDDPLNEVEDNA